jgi:ABC-type multidrug transport system fused ATPase/permease subunit
VIDTYKKLLVLFPPKQRRQAKLMGPAILLTALLQVAGIGSVMPFLAVVSDPTIIQRNRLLHSAYEFFGFSSSHTFLLMLGTASFALLLIGNVVTALTTWWMVRFAEMRTHYLASVVLEQYLSRPYVFFLNKNSAELGVKVLSDVVQIVTGIVLPGLQMLSQLALTVFLLAFLFAVNPVLSLLVFIGLGGMYAAIYRIVRGRLRTVGTERATASAEQFRALLETSGAIKEIKLLNLERVFLDRFKRPNLRMARAVASQSVLSVTPNYAMETIAFGGILCVVLVLLATGGKLSQVLPLVGLYGYAIMRIKPALQIAYASISMMRFNEPVLDRVVEEFRVLSAETPEPAFERLPVTDKLRLRRRIELRDITFQYPGAPRPLFEDLSLDIPAGSSVAFVGLTGSGKTTLVDIVLGLLVQDSGSVLIDGVPVTTDNRREWQADLSYVPQQIYLSDDSVMRNIAFGMDAAQIDVAAVERAAKIANIHEFIVNELPQGYDTFVGERGARLSGGQRQRIGIARALYREGDVLILDEATSALDGITEAKLFASIKTASRTKTLVIVAHRIQTVRDCDTIFMMDRGRIIATGTFDELLSTNDQFRAMARLTSDHPDSVAETGAAVRRAI